MSVQYELDFTTDYIFDLLNDLRYMAHTFSTAPHSEKISNQPAFNQLRMQIHTLRTYALLSEIIDLDYSDSIFKSVLFSIDLYWSV